MKKNQAYIFPLLFSIGFLVLLWIIQLIQWIYGVYWTFLGVYPLKLRGLVGIITMPLVHGGFKHLISNSFPLLFLVFTLFYFYKNKAINVLFFIWITTGIWLWLFAREAWHIGASGLIFGLFGYILFSGILSKKKELIAISLLVWFLYAGSIWGILPGKPEISWEGHLLGLLSGTLLAFYHYFQSRKLNKNSEYQLSNDFTYRNNSWNMKINYKFKEKKI